jgi:hypothetical protein
MRPTGQLEKSLASLTIAIKQGELERNAALADGHMGEHTQQIHVPVSGIATSTWATREQNVNFLMPFLYAPLQRQVPFEVPHFHYGVEFKAPPSDLVLVVAHVLSWTRTEENWIVGAKMQFAAQAPNFVQQVINTVTKPEPHRGGVVRAGETQSSLPGIPFNATVHLSFQGWATYAEGEEFDQ